MLTRAWSARGHDLHHQDAAQDRERTEQLPWAEPLAAHNAGHSGDDGARAELTDLLRTLLQSTGAD